MNFRQMIAAITAVCFLSIGFQATASATVIGTQAYLNHADRASQIAKIQTTLSRQDVRDQFVRLGVDPVAATERVASLSDRELASVSDKLDALPAGGDVLVVIGIVFVVLLILELTGVIDIFKKF